MIVVEREFAADVCFVADDYEVDVDGDLVVLVEDEDSDDGFSEVARFRDWSGVYVEEDEEEVE